MVKAERDTNIIKYFGVLVDIIELPLYWRLSGCVV